MLRPRPRTLLGVGIPIAVVVILLAAWAIDSGASGGRVMRNVAARRAWTSGGCTRTSSPRRCARWPWTTPRRPSRSAPPGHTYETTAGKIGLSVDEPATVMAALDVGRTEAVALRPLNWVASFVHRREAPLRFKVRRRRARPRARSRSRARTDASRSSRRSGPRATWWASPAGRAGSPSTPRTSPAACWRRPRTDGDRSTVRTEPVEQPPTYNDAVAQQLADEMTEKTAKPLLVLAGRARGRGPAGDRAELAGLRARHRRAPRSPSTRRRWSPTSPPRSPGSSGRSRTRRSPSAPTGRSITPSQTGIRCCDAERRRRGARRHQRRASRRCGSKVITDGARRSRPRRPTRSASRSRSARPSSGRACSR